MKKKITFRELNNNLRMYKNIGFKKFFFQKKHFNISSNRSCISISLGIFCGLLPAPFQMFSAAIIAYFLNLNVAVAVITTLYTNPITILPIYIFCLKIGLIFINFITKIGLIESNANGLMEIDNFQIFLQNLPQLNLSRPNLYIQNIIDWLLPLGIPFISGIIIFSTCLSIAVFLFLKILVLMKKYY